MDPNAHPPAHADPPVGGDDVRARVAAALADHPALIDLTALWLSKVRLPSQSDYLTAVVSWLKTCRNPITATSGQLQMWLDHMSVRAGGGRTRPAALSTLTQRTHVISSWYRHLIAHHAANHNPAVGIKLPKPGAPEPGSRTTLSVTASAVLLDHALDRAQRLRTEASWRDAAMIAMLFTTAISPRTLARAQMTDLVGLTDPTGPLTLRVASTRPAGPAALLQLPPLAARPLRTYLAARATRHHQTPPQLHGPLLLTVPSRSGSPGNRPLSAEAVAAVISKLTEQAGLPQHTRITPHPAPAVGATPTPPVVRLAAPPAPQPNTDQLAQ